jgi:hypothetical protein
VCNKNKNPKTKHAKTDLVLFSRFLPRFFACSGWYKIDRIAIGNHGSVVSVSDIDNNQTTEVNYE